MSLFFPHTTRPPTFVLDVSVATAWVVLSKSDSYTSGALTRLSGTSAVVPHLFPVDIAEAWLAGEASGEVTPAFVDRRLAQLHNFPLYLDDGLVPHVWTAAVPLARRLGLPMRRAAYLELAVRLSLPLATTDPTLIAAAPAAGVVRLTP